MATIEGRENRAADAERHYEEALALLKDDKQSPEVAATLSGMGSLYYESSKLELAREKLSSAVPIYQKSYRAAGREPMIGDAYAQALAEDSSLLSKIAVKEGKREEAVRNCRILMDVRKSLATNDVMVSDCERLIAESPQPGK